MVSRDDYKFLSIVDAVASINQKVNLIGVVVEFSIPKRSKGTDWFCTLKIIDESYNSRGISVNIFAENMEKLPHVESSGDIVQLTRVVMKTHGSDVYALFNKKFSSFALFQGKHSSDFSPYQVSSKYQPRKEDTELIVDLRKWMIDFQLDAGLNETLAVKEIKEGEQFDLVCKILHIYEVAEDEWIIFVWDGTDAPPTSIQAKLEDEMVNPLPLQIEPMPLARDTLCTFPSVGSILRVIVRQGNDKLGLQFLIVGRWVRFINMICEVRWGLWCGVLMPFSRLRFLPNEDRLIIDRQRCYEERISSRCGPLPLSSMASPSFITAVDYEGEPFDTLMNVLTYPQVTAKFKCVVRVVAVFPWQAKDLRSPNGTYRIRLTLEDPTARIHAYVFAEDGEKLFDGHPSIDVLTRKLQKLLGVAESDDGKEIKNIARNPKWVQCHIKSYYLVKNDPWATRNYRVFGTRLLG